MLSCSSLLGGLLLHSLLVALTPASAAGAADPLRVNPPLVPFKLEPLRWGSVRATVDGWIHDWALAGRNGLGSPEHAPFAHITNETPGVFHSHGGRGTGSIGTLTGTHGVNGWRDGRPAAAGFWDEDSAYWIDGMTRMSQVLNDSALLERVAADYAAVQGRPIDMHNTWTDAHDLVGGSAEGWVRSIYARGLLAYFDATADKNALDFLVRTFSNYTATDSTSDRSLTQIEALLESHAYGAPRAFVDTALGMMATNPTAVAWAEQLNGGGCLQASQLDPHSAPPSAPAPVPADVCSKPLAGKDLRGGGVLDRKANVSLSACCEMCVNMTACGGYVHCPKCPLTSPPMGPDTENCFLIHGPIHGTRTAGTTGSGARSSGIVRGSVGPSGSSCPIKGTHGVTFNELAKLHAMAYSWNGNASYLNASLTAFKMLDKFDVQVHGVNSAQEALSGIGPNVGTETCDIVDYTYSNEWLLRITGDARVHGDRLEKAFHNAAPGAINRTFSGHVYHQSPNLVASSRGYTNLDEQGDHAWRMEWFHQTPCCTGNQARLLPNYIHHSWYGTPDGGIAATMYGPTTVNLGLETTTNGHVNVQITTNTTYPFSDVVLMEIKVLDASTATFPLLLRIPAWCDTPLLTVAGKSVDNRTPDQSGFVRVEREWKSGEIINLTLPAEIVAKKRRTFGNGLESRQFNPKTPWGDQNTTSNLPFCEVSRGSLTFALPMEADPTGEFGFAIDCDAATMRFAASPLPDAPWDWPLDAPLTIKAKSKPFHWDDAWRLPSAPVTAAEVTGPERELTLVPYGSTKVLRISMFPYLA